LGRFWSYTLRHTPPKLSDTQNDTLLDLPPSFFLSLSKSHSAISVQQQKTHTALTLRVTPGQRQRKRKEKKRPKYCQISLASKALQTQDSPVLQHIFRAEIDCSISSSIPPPLGIPAASMNDSLMEILSEELRRKMKFEANLCQISVEEAWKACVDGDDLSVKLYLATTDYPKPLTAKVNEHKSTALHQASATNHPGTVEILRLLFIDGANINAQDCYGDTALMKACTHGQLKNVLALLNCGADTKMRNNSEKTAYDIARLESEAYSETRCIPSSEQFEIDELHRAEIVKRLNHQSPSEDTTPCFVSRSEYDASLESSTYYVDFVSRFTKNALETFSFPINTWTPELKAIARLEAPEFPPQYAMSGWAHEASDNMIAGDHWTYMALGIAKALKYDFKENIPNDQHFPRRYYASHTEPQLMAWYLCELGYSVDEKSTCNIRPHPARYHPFKIFIMVNREICPECRRFAKAMNEITSRFYGFQFELTETCQGIGEKGEQPNQGTKRCTPNISQLKTQNAQTKACESFSVDLVEEKRINTWRELVEELGRGRKKGERRRVVRNQNS
jgi:hypothetical protein